MKKKILSLLLVAAMIFSLTACGSNTTNETAGEQSEETAGDSSSANDSKDLPTLKIALPTWVGYGPLYVARDKGFFEECGVNVELSIVEGLAERKQALISGNLDGLATAVDVFVNLKGADIPMDMVWLLDRSNGADGIVATSDVKTPADLKGKTVATEVGTTEHLFLLKVLEQYGLSADDINLIPMTIGDSGTAFVAGKVDAAVTYDPYLSQGIEAGGTAFTTADYDVDLMDAVGFTQDVIDSEPDAVQAFVNGLSKAVDYIAENKDECIPIEAEGLKLEEKDVSDTLAELECYNLDENLEQMGKTEGEEGKLYQTVQDISDFYVDQKLNDKAVQPADIINASFIRNISN